MNSMIEPMIGRYVHVEIDGEVYRIYFEENGAGIPLVCLETALPAKFDATIREALGRSPAPPEAYADLESRPQHFEVLDARLIQVGRRPRQLDVRRGRHDRGVTDTVVGQKRRAGRVQFGLEDAS